MRHEGIVSRPRRQQVSAAATLAATKREPQTPTDGDPDRKLPAICAGLIAPLHCRRTLTADSIFNQSVG